MNRRKFLQHSLLSTSTLGLSGAFFSEANALVTPSTNDYKTLVVVNLNGGNDSLNMLIPNTGTEYQQYESARAFIAYPKNSLLPISPAGMPPESFAVNPQMPEVQSLFSDGYLSFVANVGSLAEPLTKAEFLDLDSTKLKPFGIGGHNSQTAYWQGDHSNLIDTSRDGWGARMANEFNVASELPINISAGAGSNLLQTHQEQAYYNIGLSGLVKMRDFSVGSINSRIQARRNVLAALNNLAGSSTDPFLQHAGNLFETSLELNMTLQTEIDNLPDLSSNFSDPVSFSGGALGAAFARAAEMTLVRRNLNMRRQIFFIEFAGFDNHFNQSSIHPNNSRDLSRYLKAFNDIMIANDLGDSVVTMTTSEFGRNLVSNGDGTDHAWGGQHMVMGGPVDGGKIYGSFPSLELGGADDYSGLGRMVPTTSVSQYGATVAKWFGVPVNRIPAVFPNINNFQTQDLGFLG